MKVLYNILLLLLLANPFMVSAQEIIPRVAGLESNEKYMSFLLQEKRLKHHEDSIIGIINDRRKLFAADSPDKDKYGKEIVRLEDELFDVRNNMGIVVSSINAIEQEFVISNLSNGGGGLVSQPTTNKISGDFISKNLSESDLAMLKRANEKESIPPQIIKSYIDNYDKMKEYVSVYDTASREMAQDVLSKFNALDAMNKLLEDSLAKVWSPVYDDKIYLYGLLLDKMNKSDLQTALEAQFKDVNQQIAAERDQVQSELVYGYPLQRKLILSYEKVIWDQMGRKVAVDSVSSLLKSVPVYDIPRLEINKRVFIPYEDIKISSPSIYNASNPIPRNEVFDYGTVYKIDVGVFTRQQPVSLFRGASPLCYEVLEDGRYRYCVGSFKDYESALKGVDELKKAGFRKTEIVLWRDGIFEALGAEKSQNTSATDANTEFYRVEIDGMGEAMGEMIKDVIEEFAADKEIARIAHENNTYIYTIGTFDNADEAQRVATAIGAVKDNIKAKVVKIEN